MEGWAPEERCSHRSVISSMKGLRASVTGCFKVFKKSKESRLNGKSPIWLKFLKINAAGQVKSACGPDKACGL